MDRIHTTYSTSVTFNKAKKELDIMNAEEYRAYRTVSNPLSDMGADSDWFDAVTQFGGDSHAYIDIFRR